MMMMMMVVVVIVIMMIMIINVYLNFRFKTVTAEPALTDRHVKTHMVTAIFFSKDISPEL